MPKPKVKKAEWEIGSKSLVGLWFHSWQKEDPTKIEWQGVVVDRLDDTFYVVRLHRWDTGEPSCFKVVPVSAMCLWAFYPTNENMVEAFEPIAEAMFGHR